MRTLYRSSKYEIVVRYFYIRHYYFNKSLFIIEIDNKSFELSHEYCGYNISGNTLLQNEFLKIPRHIQDKVQSIIKNVVEG